jgi:hypothetical protein
MGLSPARWPPRLLDRIAAEASIITTLAMALGNFAKQVRELIPAIIVGNLALIIGGTMLALMFSSFRGNVMVVMLGRFTSTMIKDKVPSDPVAPSR